jgi:hypothetical protein
MSIPLDRLYHYIESVAQDVYGDTIIYRFYPHGSKKFEDLNTVKDYADLDIYVQPQIFCNDQEPLNFEMYQHISNRPAEVPDSLDDLYKVNLRKLPGNIFDKAVILHSEKNSAEVEKYQNNQFVPVYYWNHALLALDWFRYAQHVKKGPRTNFSQPFLIYNRAWSGTREYRLKFAELLISNNLKDCCRTSVKLIDNGTHYQDCQHLSTIWRPSIQLEEYFEDNITTPCFSADFELDDYTNTDIEVVLETLFDDQRVHLTEKILRPIAMGHPFILCSTPGSLQYLQSYGFQTFGSIIDESYDQIVDPVRRLEKIISVMQEIKNWQPGEKQVNIQKMQDISRYNKDRFFSSNFLNQICTELADNLSQGLKEVHETNTFSRFLEFTNSLLKNEDYLTYRKTLPETSIKLREKVLNLVYAKQRKQ